MAYKELWLHVSFFCKCTERQKAQGSSASYKKVSPIKFGFHPWISLILNYRPNSPISKFSHTGSSKYKFRKTTILFIAITSPLFKKINIFEIRWSIKYAFFLLVGKYFRGYKMVSLGSLMVFKLSVILGMCLRYCYQLQNNRTAMILLWAAKLHTNPTLCM